MSKKLEIIDNYLVITDTVTLNTIEYPRNRVRYKDQKNNIDFVYIDDRTQNETFQFSELVDSTGTAFASLALLLVFLRENTGVDSSLSLEASSIFPATDIEGNGTSTIGTTAAAVVFTGETRAILISAGDTNLGRIYIGKSDVTSAGANALTFLGAGESLELVYEDVTNPIFVVGSAAGQEVLTGATLA